MKLIYLSTLLLTFVACSQEMVEEHYHTEIALPENSPAENSELTTLEFKSFSLDFGVISDTSEPIGVFQFKNSGDVPAILRQVNPSCNCTVPEYARNGIAPGASSEIKVAFNAKPGESGTQSYQSSSVQIIGNFNDTIILDVSAIVAH